MTSYVNMFLKTEITVIPRLLDKYIGKYYNNTLCNGISWMFLTWYILHVIFDDLINALLKKMRYKEYIRIRLKRSLWYLGYYSAACLYCIATFIQHDIKFNTKTQFDSMSIASSHFILGFIVLSTFYLHSAFWESLKYRYRVLALNYFSLCLLMCFSYFFRFVEGIFRLTILMCFTQITLELTRCSVVLIKGENLYRKIICGLLFLCSTFFFILNCLVVLYIIIDPLIRRLSPSSVVLLLFLLSWLILEIHDSVLFKTIIHWLNHTNCEKDILECTLFPPRNDATYNFLILRKEVKEREEKYLSLRRPKNRNVVMQTLKCMVAIKRKLNEKRLSASTLKEDNLETTSPEESEKTEEFSEDFDVLGGDKEKNQNDNKIIVNNDVTSFQELAEFDETNNKSKED